MIDLNTIPATKQDLDQYEVEHIFHSWSYQPSQAPLRVVGSKGVRFTTEDGRERLDFSSCFVSHNIGHQDPRVIEAICEQAKILCGFAPNFSNRPRAVLAKTLAEITPGDLSRCFITLGGTEANEARRKNLSSIYRRKENTRTLPQLPRRHGNGHDSFRRRLPQLGPGARRHRVCLGSAALLLPVHVRPEAGELRDAVH